MYGSLHLAFTGKEQLVEMTLSITEAKECVDTLVRTLQVSIIVWYG